MTKSNARTFSEKPADSHDMPGRAGRGQEYDMPGAEMKELHGAFFNPSGAERSKPDQS